MACGKKIDALKNLFVNRIDAYAVQRVSGGYSKVDEPLTDWILEEHLAGRITVGSYQLDRDSIVKWACLDLDPEKLEDPKATARQILKVLNEKEKLADGCEHPRIWPHSVVLEASRWPDPSFHVWVLFMLPVKAKVARWLGLRVLELANLNPKMVEVFPKQDEITQDRPFGNFVKLPFGRHQVADKWSRMLDIDTFEPVDLNCLEEKHGLTFTDADLEKMEQFETKKSVQTSFTVPATFKELGNDDEEKTASFLCKYWIEGYRNTLEMGFLGMCIKRGVSRDSARRVIEEVCTRTHTSSLDTVDALSKVDYHYLHRLNINLKGISGVREVVEAIRRERKQC